MAQPIPINFGEVTKCICPDNTANFQYSLTLPQWPDTPARDFLIELRGSVPTVTASAGNKQWHVLPDSSTIEELWIPRQDAGTMITVMITCDHAGNFTLEPVFPAAISKPTDLPDFTYASVTAATPGGHWWAIPSDKTKTDFGFVWAELCDAPSSFSYLLYMRVVFPGVNSTSDACKKEDTDAFYLTGESNFRQNDFVSIRAMWDYGTILEPVFYVNIYSTLQVDLSYNIYLTSYVSRNIIGNAVQIENDLFIGGTGENPFPTDTNDLKLYVHDNSDTISPQLFESACFLKNHGQKSLFSGHLQNASHDSKLSQNTMKAHNFFKAKRNNTSPYPYVYALTYRDYIVLPPISGSTHFKGYVSNGHILLGFLIALAVISGLLIVVVIILGVKLRSA